MCIGSSSSWWASSVSCISQKRALGARRLGGLGRHLRVRVHVVEREVAPDVAQVVAEGVEQLADDDLGLAAVRALVVAVLDAASPARRRAPRTWSRSGSTSSARSSELVGGAAQLARARRGRDQRDHAERRPTPTSGARIAPARTPSFASSSSLAARRRCSTISSETVKPMPATAPPPASDRPADRQPRPPSTRRVASHDAPRMPERLADHVADHDARA